MEQTKVKMNKLIYLGMSILGIIKILMTKQNYVTWILTALLFILKLKVFMKLIANDVEKWFDTFNYDENDKRPLPMDKK